MTNFRHTTELSLSKLGKNVGALANLFWFGSLNFLFAMAINRFIALARPLEYKTVDFLKSKITSFKKSPVDVANT